MYKICFINSISLFNCASCFAINASFSHSIYTEQSHRDTSISLHVNGVYTIERHVDEHIYEKWLSILLTMQAYSEKDTW